MVNRNHVDKPSSLGSQRNLNGTPVVGISFAFDQA
jgi:hypothetical protein